MKRHLVALLLAACAPLHAAEPSTPQPVRLAIDATQVKGPMTPIWAWFGYDEPNYTTAPAALPPPLEAGPALPGALHRLGHAAE